MRYHTSTGSQEIAIPPFRVNIYGDQTLLTVTRSVSPKFELYEALFPSNKLVAQIRIRSFEATLYNGESQIEAHEQLESSIKAGGYEQIVDNDPDYKNLSEVIRSSHHSIYRSGPDKRDAVAISVWRQEHALLIEIPFILGRHNMRFLADELKSSIRVEVR